MLIVAVVVLFAAIYFYTYRVAQGVDSRADRTDELVGDLARQSAITAAEIVDASERQRKAFEDLRKSLTAHDQYLFETGRELSAPGRDLRLV